MKLAVHCVRNLEKSLSGVRDVYQVTGNTKAQISLLCAVSAIGNVIPPMHIFPSQRFKNNHSMEGCVLMSYFGKAEIDGLLQSSSMAG